MKNDKVFELGLFMKTSDPSFVEIAVLSGFDFLIFDYEHGVTDFSQMTNLIRASKIHNSKSIIRTSGIVETEIGKALDIGVDGIQVPQIKNSKDVEKVIEYSKFFPEGKRGVCRFVRAANYSITPQIEYYKSANNSSVIIQLEGIEAIDNIDDIIAIKGIDIVFIGPYDLSQSLGLPGDIFNPIVTEKMSYIIDKCNEKKIRVGTFVDNFNSLKIWKKLGVSYIAFSVDVGIFADKCREIVDNSNSFDL
jgi:4-hydroxy-2-oxoheptanedioate aldolase